MLTDRDVCIATYTQGRPLADIEVESAMAHSVCSCRTTDNVKVALKVMQANQIHRLPVVDGDEHLVGLLSLADIAREAAREQEQPRKAVTAVDVGETVEMIAQPRSGGGQVVPAAPAA
jgi:CBS-domain-containing membrane protein